MKSKMICLAVLSLVLFGFSMADAALPQYTVTAHPLRIGSGGPFTVDPVDPGANFLSFCLEMNETLSLGRTYYGSIDEAAVYGGVNAGGIADSDPLSIETKKLYSYALDNKNVLNATQFKAIQDAIWAYEEEKTVDSLGAAALGFYNDAPTFDLTWDVYALNLWKNDVGAAPYDNTFAYESRVQSLLIADPVPEPGILILLGASFAGLGFAVRRFRNII